VFKETGGVAGRYVVAAFKVKIFYVNVIEAGVSGGDDGVNEELDGGEVCGGGVNFDKVDVDYPTDAIWIGFLGMEGGDDAEIRGFLHGRNFEGVDKRHRVCSFGVIGVVAITEACNLLGAGNYPVGDVFTFVEVAVLLKLTGDGVEDGVECVL